MRERGTTAMASIRLSRGDRVFSAVRMAFLIVLCLVIGVPFLMAVSVSLQTMPEINAPKITLIPETAQWQNYADAMHNGDWGLFLKNSAVITVITVVISLVINSMSGYVFARIPFRGSNALFLLILVGMMIPAQVTLIPVFRLIVSWPLAGGNNIFGQGGTGLYNTYAGLILPYIAGSFGVFLCRQFYVGFPHELDDAAQIDGCGRFGQFLRIYLPLSGPVLASLGVLKFTGAWNEYMWPLVMTSGESLRTVQIALTMFRDESEIKWNLLMAATIVGSLPIYTVFFFAQKQFVSGLLAGSVKG